MNFLFIHGNFPAQFKNIAPTLAKSGHRVVYIANQEMANENRLEGVELHYYKCHRRPSKETHHYLAISEQAVINGQAVIRKIVDLGENGFTPDVIITHAGAGYGLFIKDLLPKAVHIGYFEWYFLHNTAKHLIKDYDINAKFKVSMRNMPIIKELEQCDAAVVPTEWQKRQFPAEYSEKMKVIFDGIDTRYFHEYRGADIGLKELTLKNRETKEEFKLQPGSKIISYATRGMESLRGFPEYMRLLPDLMKEDPNIIAVIAGADRRAYSYDAPTHNGSWKLHMLDELKRSLPQDRVIFTGLLDYEDYRKLLWRANVHCYFTREYVTSWSFFEAAACGANIVVNKNKATEDIAYEKSVTWIELENKKESVECIRKALANKKGAKLMEKYYLANSLTKWEKLLSDQVRRKLM